MLELNESYKVPNRISKSDFIRYSPSEKSSKKTANSHIFENKPEEYCFFGK